MIFKKTLLNITDNTNAKWCQTFHLYKGFYRKQTKIGYFVKSSVRIIEPPRIEYKGFKIKFNKKGDISRNLIIRQKFKSQKPDSSQILFKYNNGILIKKKFEIKSKYLYGPITTLVKRKKILTLFKSII